MVKKIFIILLFSVSAEAMSSEVAAIQNASLAAYKQTGMEKTVNSYVETLISKKYKDILIYVNPIASIVTTKRVEVTWNF